MLVMELLPSVVRCVENSHDRLTALNPLQSQEKVRAAVINEQDRKRDFLSTFELSMYSDP